MKFNINSIRQFVDRETIDPRTKVKEISYFTKERHRSKLQSKALCLTVLQVKTPSPASRTASKISSFNQNKKNKITLQPAKSYHRYFLCADASNPPHCFALITHSVAKTMMLTKHLEDESYIGTFFYLIEPDMITSTIGEYLQVVDYKRQNLVPLSPTATVISRPSPIVLPATSEETFYFVLENQQIKITKSDSTDDTCKGFSCDRQKNKAECSCLTLTGSNALVYQFDIEFQVDRTQFNYDTYVASLSSFRTCTVFFHNFVDYCNATNPKLKTSMLFRRRSQIRRIAKYINCHGGWKLIGWCKKGLLQIDGEAEKIPNNKVALHLSYAYPQNPEIMETEDFSNLQIKNDFKMSLFQLKNLDSDEDESSDSSDTSNESNGDDEINFFGPRLSQQGSSDDDNDDDDHRSASSNDSRNSSLETEAEDEPQ